MYTEVQDILECLPGRAAFVLARLEQDGPRWLLMHNADLPFPAASLAKVPILVELARHLAASGCGHRWETCLEVPATARVPSDGVLADLSPALRPSIHDLAHLMITISDNTASNVLLDLLGMDAVNTTMNKLGLKNTRLERYFIDFAARQAGRDNWTSATDMALLLSHIHYRRVPERERLLQILLRQNDYHILPAYWNEELLFAHKTGGLAGILHDAGLLYRTPDDPAPLVVVALTAEQSDIPLTNLCLARIGRAIREEWLLQKA